MIAIIGGGITGLTTALALEKMGISCHVYEKATELNEVGAGLWLQPNAMKILDWLDIGEKVRKSGKQIDEFQITNKDLIPIRKSNRKFLADDKGTKITAIHRARFQKILYDSLPENNVSLGKEYKDHSIIDNTILIQFQDLKVEADLLLAADGIHSRVRNNAFHNTSTRYSGQSCWRGIAKMTLPVKQTTTGSEAWGNKIRFGYSGISNNEVYWFAVVKSKPNQRDETDKLKQKLLNTFHSFDPLISDLITNTSNEKIIRNDIIDLKPLKTWSSDRICLIGDAAHATTPNMGQGACQGIEDAFFIAQNLKNNKDFEKAFHSFEAERRKKVDYVVKNSWQFGKMAHSPTGQALLKLIMKLTPEKIILLQMKKLYAVTPLENNSSIDLEEESR